MLELKKLFYLLMLLNIVVVMLYMYIFHTPTDSFSHKKNRDVTNIIRLDNSTSELQLVELLKIKK